MFYKPDADEPRPLLVALHSWSSDYRQPASAIYAEWCIANGWVFIHPNFRGRNVRPEATGSELVVKDVLSAVDYAKQNARVDGSRFYAVGWSGGGHLALLTAGRAPEIWAGISAWAPSSDLIAWYEESKRLGTKYFREIEASCGGPPIDDSAAAQECRRRSPITYLERARGVQIDINHGIRDGHGGASTLVSQSLHAFNILAKAGDSLSPEEIAHFTDQAEVPPDLRSIESYPPYGDKKVLFRRQSENVRLSIFDGGHTKDTEAAMMWLNQQRRSG
jgi:pimeloyl-ACP methyl ester carboxylesterase